MNKPWFRHVPDKYGHPAYGIGNLLPIEGVGEEMVVTFITQDQDGLHTFTGHVVSRGPTTVVLLLTEPFGLAGRSVQFRISDIVEEKAISA